MTLIKTIRFILISARPSQWLKNVILFGAAFLAGNLFDPQTFLRVTAGFVVFCIVSSAMYIFNDVMDREKDRLHPVKKHRPIASGKLSPIIALISCVIFLAIAFPLSFKLSHYFFLVVFAYVVLQLAYSSFLRDVIIIDALTIALGFIFRVFAGALVVPVSISSWLVLTTIGLSLLMAFGKRRSERTLLEVQGQTFDARAALRDYPDTLLDSAISTFSAFTILSYSLFAFQTSPTASAFQELLPSILAKPKWMLLTVPVVIYGVTRYLYVIYEKKEGESPAEVLLSDVPLLLSVLCWALAVWVIVYVLGGNDLF
ncbi:MAG: decaprenyl-phosphate phosphoribosyltransferase [Patescibacteria group bacterium]|nr:decaprenyl-phosphate phosphoribosyltransferase [Patescibacteria group bacterium]